MNTKRLKQLGDANDMIYSEFFISLEIMIRQLYNLVSSWNDKTNLRGIASVLEHQGVVAENESTKIDKLIDQRNSLFHGGRTTVSCENVNELEELVLALNWYFRD